MVAQITMEQNPIQRQGLKRTMIWETAPTVTTQGAYCVKQGTNDEHIVETAAVTDKSIGFVNSDSSNPLDSPTVAVGDRATVYGHGNIVWAKCNGAVARGDSCTPSTQGRIAPRGAVATTLYQVCAHALSAGADADFIPVEVRLFEMTA